MKYLIPITFLVFLLASCNSGADTQKKMPQELSEKQALLKEKRAELKELTDFVAKLETAIAEQDPSVKAKQGRLVTTRQLERQTFDHYVELQGLVAADDLVDVSPEVAGRIVQLTVKEGDNVNSGQLIAELDLEQLERQIAEVETSLDLAKTVFERQSRLWKQNIGSEMQFLEAKNSKERLEKSLETLHAQLSKSKVFAPITGVVDKVVLQGGEFVSPGMPIIQILNTNRLKVEADVPETYLQAVRRGEMVTVIFPALDMERRERVSLVGRSIDPANRTFKVEVNVGNPGGMLKPNLLAKMLINDFTIEDAVVVPLEVVQQEVSGNKYVYVIEAGAEGPVARKVYVEIGRSYKGNVLIEQGLEGGETLVIEGGRGLAADEPVKIVNPKTQASNG